MAHPRLSPTVRLFLLGDSGILFDEAAQEVYHLNATAAYLCCRLEEGLSPDALAAALSETFGFSPETARAHLDRTLADWQARGLLAASAPRRQVAKPLFERTGANFPAHKIESPPGSTVRHYRALAQGYAVAFDDGPLEALVHPVFRHLEVPPPGTPETRILVGRAPEGFVIARAGGPTYRCSRLEEVAPLAKQLIFAHALEGAGQAIAVHAGGVCDGTVALMLPGAAGSGKTTLTAALVATGFTYLSDDLLLLDADDRGLSGVPFGLTIKEGGSQVLADRFPGLAALPLHRRADAKQVRYLALPPQAQTREGGPRPDVRWIVFPRYDPAGDNRLERLAAGEALVRLTQSCTILRRVSADKIAGLIALVERADCYQLTNSSLDKAVAALTGLFAGDRPIAMGKLEKRHD